MDTVLKSIHREVDEEGIHISRIRSCISIILICEYEIFSYDDRDKMSSSHRNTSQCIYIGNSMARIECGISICFVVYNYGAHITCQINIFHN